MSDRTTMPIYIPSQSPAEITSTVYVRQNPWEKSSDILYSKISKKLHLPFAHTKQTVDAFTHNPTTFLEAVHEDHKEKVKSCIHFPIGTVVIVPNGKKGLLVCINSELKAGVQETLCIACSPRTCGHEYIQSGAYCLQCHNSVKEVFETKDIAKLSMHLREGNLIEPFYILYYDVEILGDADYNGADGRKIAGMNSVGFRVQHWGVT